MTINKVLELLRVEKTCITWNKEGTCDRNCEKCMLVQSTDELIEAYETAIAALENLDDGKEAKA